VTAFVEIALFTDDVDGLRRFYDGLSAPRPRRPGRGRVYAAGGVKLLLHERAGASPDGPPNEDHVALGVPDVDVACDALRERGFALLFEPRDYPWGRSAYLRDPDGRLVELSRT
jgi:catechol 2,3-dioxygenase-like lactoylglutathione lyase family enzyme